MSERRAATDVRLALPVAVAWLVLGVALGADEVLGPAAVVAGLSSVLALITGRGRARTVCLVVALAAGASALLLASAAASVDERRPAELSAAAGDSRHVVMRATVTDAVLKADSPARFGATLDSVRVGADVYDVEVPVTVFAALDRSAEVGDEVELAGSLVETPPADASAYLVFARGAATVSPASAGPIALAGELRAGFRMLVAELPRPGGGLLPGLAIGDTSAVGTELGDDMKASSLTHLTAVSGANCAIVVGLVLALGAAFRLPRLLRILASLLALAAFVLIVTPEPSVLRASVMAVAVLVAQAAGRGAAGVPVLALAVLVLLAIDPWLARSYGFVLSVLATAALLVLAGPLAEQLARFMPRMLALVLAVPLSAQLACQPVIILLSPSIPLYGVVANLLAGPAAPLATVVGLLACLVAPIASWPAHALAWVAWVPSAWIAAVAQFFSRLPGSQLPWAEGAFGFGLAAILTVLGLGAVLARRRRWWALGLCGVLVMALGVAAGERLRVALYMPAEWQFAACDVGQGDAQLLRDGEAVMLVDTGPDAAALEECLATLGVTRVDTLVLTHFDLDHVGGADGLVGRVGTVVAGPVGSADDTRMLDRFAEAGARVVAAARGTSGQLGRLTWSVLWPAAAPAMPPGNDASVVLAVDGGACACLTSVLLGDLGQEAQVRTLAGARAQLAALGEIDIVKVSHHGSADQSEPLYEQFSARLGVIGVGEENTYGHPARSILDTLARAGTEIARTDTHGLVLAWAREGDLIGLWTERRATDGGGALSPVAGSLGAVGLWARVRRRWALDRRRATREHDGR